MYWVLGIEQNFRLDDDLDLDVASKFISFILFKQGINISERKKRRRGSRMVDQGKLPRIKRIQS